MVLHVCGICNDKHSELQLQKCLDDHLDPREHAKAVLAPTWDHVPSWHPFSSSGLAKGVPLGLPWEIMPGAYADLTTDNL